MQLSREGEVFLWGGGFSGGGFHWGERRGGERKEKGKSFLAVRKEKTGQKKKGEG